MKKNPPFPLSPRRGLPHVGWCMTCLQSPTPDRLDSCLAAWAEAPLSYRHAGGVAHRPAQGFLVDHHEIRLGSGSEAYQRAAGALDAWRMFPHWGCVARTRYTGQTPGDVVAMVVRLAGLWWINPCRILQRLDSPASHGFVYGTLPEHAECGEEAFIVEHRGDNSVWYVIHAFSKPRHPLAWIGFPVARWWQLRFVRDSQQRMVEATA